MSAHHPLRGLVHVERAERHDLDASGTVQLATHTTRAVTVINLSISGCLVKGPIKVAIDDRIRISIITLRSRMATVRRIAEDGAFGCSFDHLLKPSEVETAIASLAMQVPNEPSDVVRRMRARVAETDQKTAAASRGHMMKRITRRIARRRT